MKKISLIIFGFLALNSFSQNPGEWVWLHGDSITTQGSFGIQGIPSSMNEPPSLYEATQWTAKDGTFWLWGGHNDYNFYSDVWKYDPFTNEWTWMKGPGIVNYQGSYGVQGVPSQFNNPQPQSFGTNYWVDVDGNFWVFGGGSGTSWGFNDLWKYTIATNEWTWMKGPGIGNDLGNYGQRGIPDPGNNPPSRTETTVSWVDTAGDFWLFGGTEINGSTYNDLWRYNVPTNMWTWIKGSNITGQNSVYGTIGVEDSANTPGARWVYPKWLDNSGKFWLYGGYESSSGQFKTDMWRFNPVTNNWAWMDGDSNYTNVAGVACISSPANNPDHGIECPAVWTDVAGNFYWLIYNSMWMYCFGTQEWAMINSSNGSINGVWGTKGISSPGNIPPSLSGPIGWTDNNGHLYVYGGWGGWGGGIKWSNALWMYTLDPCCTACPQMVPSLNFSADDICPGSCTDIANNSQSYTSYQWLFPGGNPSSGSGYYPPDVCYNTTGTYNIMLIATGCNTTDTITQMISVYPNPLPQSISQSGDTLFANTGATSYQWYYNGNILPGATEYFYIATAAGDYNLIATDMNGCEVEAVVYDVMTHLDDIVQPGIDISIFPNPVKDKLKVYCDCVLETIVIYKLIGEIVFEAVINNQSKEIEVDISFLENGIYFLKGESSLKSFQKKLVKI